MTKVYFIRHAKPDYAVKDDSLRPLTEESINDCKKITEFLRDKNIRKAYSSPYKRAMDTIRNFTDSCNMEISVIDNFKERKIDNVWIEDFDKFAKEQWADFNYKLSGGESLNEVQKRNVWALMEIIKENENKNIIIGSHGTALSTVINYFNKEFGYAEFERIRDIMPFIVCFTFDGKNIKNIEEFILK